MPNSDHTLAEYKQRLARLSRDIEKKEEQLIRFGVLDGAARLEANKLRTDRARLEALVHDGNEDLDAATVAADLQALENSFQGWAAWTDRSFVSKRGKD